MHSINNGKKMYWKVSSFLYSLQCGWNRWNKKYKLLRIFPRNLIVFVFLIGSLLAIYKEYTAHPYTILYDNEPHYNIPFDRLYKKGITFSLDRPGVKGKVNSIGVKVGTYARVNHARYTLTILKNKKSVYKKEISTSSMRDYLYSFFTIPDIDGKELSQYECKLEPINTNKKDHITLYGNGSEVALRLAKQNNPIRLKLFVFSGIIILMFFILYRINTHKVTETKAYLIIGLLLSTTIIVTPPYQVPDEFEHFFRTLNLSQYNFSKLPYDNISSQEIYFPDYKKLDYSNATGRNQVSGINAFVKAWQPSKLKKIPYTEKQRSPNIAIAYLIPAIVVKLAGCISNSAMFIFLAGRIGAYAFNFWLTYLAIKITPKYKSLFLFAATIPMVFQTMGSYSYDGILNASSILFIALVVKCMSEKKPIKISTMALMLALITLITIIKIPYALLGSIVFFIPRENFPFEKRNKWGCIAIGIVLMLFLYEMNVNFFNLGNSGAKSVVVINRNLQYLISNPLRTITILINTFIINGNFYIQSFVGFFGWLNFAMHPIFKFAMLGIVIGILGSQKNILCQKQRLFLLSSISIIGLGIFLALYFAWTPYKYVFIDGVQGRYFIPLFIPLALALTTPRQRWLLSNETLYSYITIALIQYILILVVYLY